MWNRKPESAMPCKIYNCRHKETCGVNDSSASRTRSALITETHEPSRTRIGKTEARFHEDLIAAKGFNSLTHYNLGHKPVPMCEPRCDKEWEKLEKLPAWQVTNVKNKKTVVFQRADLKNSEQQFQNKIQGSCGLHLRSRVRKRHNFRPR